MSIVTRMYHQLLYSGEDKEIVIENIGEYLKRMPDNSTIEIKIRYDDEDEDFISKEINDNLHIGQAFSIGGGDEL